MTNAVSEIFTKLKEKNNKQLAVLIDPDTSDKTLLNKLAETVEKSKIELVFFGGSLLTQFELDEKINFLKKNTSAKIITYPSNIQQISAKADALLFLSLISGRNPELLIGQQVIAAPLIKKLNIETLATGYMLIDGGRPTTANYMSGTLPIPADKPDIAACTAIAGELLGLKHIFLDTGSGALNHVSLEMVKAVRKNVDLPIIVGGGIKTADAACDICSAGADVIVVGNATEKNPLLISEIASALREL